MGPWTLVTTARDLLTAYKALPAEERVRIEAEADRVKDLSGELALKSGRSALRAGLDRVSRDDEDGAATPGKPSLLGHLTAEDRDEERPVDRETRAIMDELSVALMALSAAAGPGVLDYVEDNSRTVRWANKAVGFGAKRFKRD